MRPPATLTCALQSLARSRPPSALIVAVSICSSDIESGDLYGGQRNFHDKTKSHDSPCCFLTAVSDAILALRESIQIQVIDETLASTCEERYVAALKPEISPTASAKSLDARVALSPGLFHRHHDFL